MSLHAVREFLMPEGANEVDNYGLLSALFSFAESNNQQPFSWRDDHVQSGLVLSPLKGS